MNKSVVILIGIIYVASVVFIGFFGSKIKVYDEFTYITEIQCLNTDKEEADGSTTKITQDNEGTFVILWDGYDQNKSDDQNVVPIMYKVLPEDASNKKVTFIYDTNCKYASVDQKGIVWFHDLTKTRSITVTIKSNDGSNSKTTIRIYAIVK